MPPKDLVYAAEQACKRASERSRRMHESIAEIGPPPKADAKLVRRYRKNLWLFLTECFPQTLGLSPLSADHKRIITRLQDCILRGGQELIIMPRGFAKSTIAECASIWAVGFGHREFFVPLAATDEMARLMLDSISFEIETNEKLLKVFPAVCHCARALAGRPMRAATQSIEGELTRIEWTAERLVFPSVKKFSGSGGIIWPRSIEARGLRGTRYKRPDGKQARPDFVCGDDLQTSESAASPSQTNKRLGILNRTVLRLGSHQDRLAIVVTSTIIELDDMIDQLADHKKNPSWRVLRVGMLKSLPTSLTEEWLTKYAEIRTSYDPDDEDGKARAEQEANDYYASNRTRMDAGGEATWDHCFDHTNECSAIQHAVNIMIDSGMDAFMAECQNAPVRQQTSGVDLLTADEVVRKVSPPAPDATILTAFVDIGDHVFDYEVWAWSPDETGYQIAGGNFPDQKRKYFSHRQPAHTLDKMFPKMSVEARITHALEALLHGQNDNPGLMTQEWNVAESPLKIRCCLVDANGTYRDQIVRVLTNSPHSANLYPSFGIGIHSKRAPISAWADARKQRTGGQWCLTKGTKGEIRGLAYDTNSYKSRFHRRLALPKGTKGAIYLNPNAPDIRMVADHYLSELPTEVSANGRTIIEWNLKPNCDNHRLDCAVGNVVASLVAGVGRGPATSNRRPKRKTTYF